MLLEGKKGLVLNITNRNSIGWGVAKAAAEHGAQMMVGVQTERMEKKASSLVGEYDNMSLVTVDFGEEEQMDALYKKVESEYGKIDFLVHAAAFAQKEDLEGRFIETSREGFKLALDVSAYSLVGLCQKLEPLFNEDASIMTLSYLGSTRAVGNYNVMGVAKAALESCVRYLAVDLGPRGIRVNTISPGPIGTVAARGIAGFSSILEHVKEKSPLKRDFGQDEVGTTACYLMSDLSKGVTGQIIFVDSGYNFAGI
jgi:enoyl-[acyl-carrier protein] reductase I